MTKSSNILFSRPLIRILSGLVPLAIAAFMLAGCATIPREVLTAEPSLLLESDPQVYIRLSGAVLRDVTATLGEDDLSILASAVAGGDVSGAQVTAMAGKETARASSMGISTFEGIVSRTRTFGAGIRGINSGNPMAEAVLIGDFQPLSIRMGLAIEGNWERTAEGGYRSIRYPLFVRPPQPGVIHVSTEKNALSRITSGTLAFPPAFAPLSQSDIFISANRLTELFSMSLPLEAASIPVSAFAVTGSKVEQTGEGAAYAPVLPEARYVLEFHILMKDEASARAYRPVVRFLWIATANRIFGDASDASKLSPVLEKDIYVVRGIEVTAAELVELVMSGIVGAPLLR